MVEKYRQTFGRGPVIESCKFLSTQEIGLITVEALHAGNSYQPSRDCCKTESGIRLYRALGSLGDEIRR